MQANVVKLLVAVFFLSYPFIVYFGLSYFPPSFFGLVLMALLAFRYGVIKSDERTLMLPILLVFLTYAVAMVIVDNDQMVLYYPALVSFVMCAVFANSLRHEESLLLRLVKARGMTTSPHTPGYLYWLTAIWAVFFLLNGLVSLWSSTVSLQTWTLYNGLLSYFIVAILGTGEWLFRRHYKKRKGVSDP
jgi:uncharacterized membrane protein